ncbi:MAG TPA: phosphopantetheine-binding protein [Ktedonobacteraceae bacterium]|nr:phosphopantetheine-binding protein [Ktedonobacteraceae bacterium]
MESIIIAYISRELLREPGQLPLRNDTSLLESGILDSLSLLKLLVFLEQEFKVPVDEFEVLPENFDTVNAICAYIRSWQQGHAIER